MWRNLSAFLALAAVWLLLRQGVRENWGLVMALNTVRSVSG